jgi:hypothetical protein
MLPYLLGCLAIATARLRELSRSLVPEPGAARLDAHLRAWEESRREVDRFGWCLGVLAGGRGDDLLLERRERRGLGLFLSTVCAAHEGLELEPPAERLPGLSARAGRGWELPFLAGWTLSSLAAGGSRQLHWSYERAARSDALRLERAEPIAPDERRALVRRGQEACRRIAPACDYRAEERGCALLVPAGWLQEGGARGPHDP